MTLKSDAKFEEKLTWCLENDMILIKTLTDINRYLTDINRYYVSYSTYPVLVILNQ